MQTIWHKIYNSSQEASQKIKLNRMYSIRVGIKKICLIHLESGLYALEDACPHKLVELSKGVLHTDGSITCFWHQYRFDICSGQELTGKNIRDVKIFPLEERSDGLYVGIPTKENPKDEFSF